MGLRDIELTLPPGFRFYPSDEELVCHYLRNKVASGDCFAGLTMVEVDLHVHEPWELPDMAKLSRNEWYFFSFRDRKYATGLRTNRATKSGYWKATGKDRLIRNHSRHGHAVVGMRKTLVFYRGRAPNGTKTCWVMHEFRIDNPPPKEDWVLCRVFHKKRAADVGTDDHYAMVDAGEQMGAARCLLDDVSASSCSHGGSESLTTYHHHSTPFPSLGGGGHYHHQLPPPSSSSVHHDCRHGGSLISDDFHIMPPLLSYDDSILDFNQHHLDGNLIVGVGSRNGGGGDRECAAAPAAVLMELGLEERYSYNSLMQM